MGAIKVHNLQKKFILLEQSGEKSENDHIAINI
jgi:hypothetical protein